MGEQQMRKSFNTILRHIILDKPKWQSNMLTLAFCDNPSRMSIDKLRFQKPLVGVAFVFYIDSKAFSALLKPLGICLSGKQKGIAYL